MSKVVIFNGSPRKNGCTAKLLTEIRKGAESQGSQIVTFDLNDPGIKGCQGCYYCRRNDGCATEDYLQPMYQEIIEADAIVVGSPIYYHQISGQVKTWLDRTFPMVAGSKFEPRHPGKKLVTVFSQGNPNKDLFAEGINFLNNILQSYGWELIDSILCFGSNRPEMDITTEQLEKAYQDGVSLGRSINNNIE